MFSSESQSIDSSDIEDLPRPDLDNADVKYQTAEELLRQKDHAADQKRKLMASYQTAGPEEQRAIEAEARQLQERINLLHETAKVRNNEEIEDIFRRLRDMKERVKEYPEKVNAGIKAKVEADMKKRREQKALERNEEREPSTTNVEAEELVRNGREGKRPPPEDEIEARVNAEADEILRYRKAGKRPPPKDEIDARVDAEVDEMIRKRREEIFAATAKPSKASESSGSSYWSDLKKGAHKVKSGVGQFMSGSRFLGDHDLETIPPRVLAQEIETKLPVKAPGIERDMDAGTIDHYLSFPEVTRTSGGRPLPSPSPSPSLSPSPSPSPSPKPAEVGSGSQTVTTTASGSKTVTVIIGSGLTVALIALMGWALSRFKMRQGKTNGRRSHSREWSASESN